MNINGMIGSKRIHGTRRRHSTGQCCMARNHYFGALLFSLGVAGTTNGQIYTVDSWINPAGGAWEGASNWSLGVAPTAYEYDVYFNLSSGSNYIVTTSGNEVTADTFVRDSDVTVDAATGHVLGTSGTLNVNASSGQSASFTFDGSSVDGTDGSGIVISQIGSHASPGEMGGGGNVLFTMNDASFTCHTEPYIFGQGTAVVLNNAYVSASMDFSGTATFNASTGTFAYGNYGTDINVVGAGGVAASFTLENGSIITLSNSNLGVGEGYNTQYNEGSSPPGIGIVNVLGSQMSVGDDIQLGAIGGTGTLNVSSGGQVICSDVVIGSGLTSITGSRSNLSASAAITIGSASTFQISSGAKATANLFNMSTGSTLAIGLDEGGIAITGLATLAGTLDVTLGSAPDPTLGETFDLITFGSETGTFSTIDLPPLDPGLAWNTQQLYINGEISVVSAVPEPASLSLLAIGSIALLGRRRKMSTGGAS